jgi:hypothetical protein
MAHKKKIANAGSAGGANARSTGDVNEQQYMKSLRIQSLGLATNQRNNNVGGVQLSTSGGNNGLGDTGDRSSQGINQNRAGQPAITGAMDPGSVGAAPGIATPANIGPTRMQTLEGDPGGIGLPSSSLMKTMELDRDDGPAERIPVKGDGSTATKKAVIDRQIASVEMAGERDPDTIKNDFLAQLGDGTASTIPDIESVIRDMQLMEEPPRPTMIGPEGDTIELFQGEDQDGNTGWGYTVKTKDASDETGGGYAEFVIGDNNAQRIGARFVREVDLFDDAQAFIADYAKATDEKAQDAVIGQLRDTFQSDLIEGREETARESTQAHDVSQQEDRQVHDVERQDDRQEHERELSVEEHTRDLERDKIMNQFSLGQITAQGLISYLSRHGGTVPNDPAVFGEMAGMELTGSDEAIVERERVAREAEIEQREIDREIAHINEHGGTYPDNPAYGPLQGREVIGTRAYEAIQDNIDRALKKELESARLGIDLNDPKAIAILTQRYKDKQKLEKAYQAVQLMTELAKNPQMAFFMQQSGSAKSIGDALGIDLSEFGMFEPGVSAFDRGEGLPSLAAIQNMPADVRERTLASLAARTGQATTTLMSEIQRRSSGIGTGGGFGQGGGLRTVA